VARSKKLNDEEEFMERKIDSSKMVRVRGRVPTRSEAVELAKGKKEARFTARVSREDFDSFKLISEKKGLGYQTLLGSIIHLYVLGRLVDVEEIKKVIPKLKVNSK
jgi:predicted DNA binding CopG/RHH family protein